MFHPHRLVLEKLTKELLFKRPRTIPLLFKEWCMHGETVHSETPSHVVIAIRLLFNLAR